MISTKGRYALRMLVYIAAYSRDGAVSLTEVSEKQQISKKYLEQIVPILNRAELLVTNRGFQGGYRLSRPAEKYTVGEILRATEGGLSPVGCLECTTDVCPRALGCETLPVWKGLEKVINDYLDGITLQDILDQKTERDASDYVI